MCTHVHTCMQTRTDTHAQTHPHANKNKHIVRRPSPLYRGRSCVSSWFCAGDRTQRARSCVTARPHCLPPRLQLYVRHVLIFTGSSAAILYSDVRLNFATATGHCLRHCNDTGPHERVLTTARVPCWPCSGDMVGNVPCCHISSYCFIFVRSVEPGGATSYEHASHRIKSTQISRPLPSCRPSEIPCVSNEVEKSTHPS